MIGDETGRLMGRMGLNEQIPEKSQHASNRVAIQSPWSCNGNPKSVPWSKRVHDPGFDTSKRRLHSKRYGKLAMEGAVRRRISIFLTNTVSTTPQAVFKSNQIRSNWSISDPLFFN